MPQARNVLSSLNTDSPPDQVGDSAIALQNVLCSSPTSVKARWGTTLTQSFVPVSAARRIYVWTITGDSTYTTFITCTNEVGGIVTPETTFPAHLGPLVYSYVDGLSGHQLLLSKTIAAAAVGLYLPTAVQYGNKCFVYYPDQRPIVVMAGATNIPAAYDCGIQPPVYPLQAIAGSDNANNIFYDDQNTLNNTLQIAYAYYSTARGVLSQPSGIIEYTIPAPTALGGTVTVTNGSASIVGSSTTWSTGTAPNKLIAASTSPYPSYSIAGVQVAISSVGGDLAATLTAPWQGNSGSGYTIYPQPKKIVLSGFVFPRDDYTTQAIDYFAIGVRSGTNAGLMSIWPEMLVPFTFTAFTGTASTTAASTTVNGSGTNFSTASVGQVVSINGVGYVITNIASNILMTINVGAASNFSGTAYLSPSLIFDLSPDQLASPALDLNALAGSLYVPPAVKYAGRFGERIWTGGQRQSITFGSTTLTVASAHLSGSVTIGYLQTTLNGSVYPDASDFQNELAPYDYVSINGTQVLVTAISDYKTATIAVAFPGVPVGSGEGFRLYRGNQFARLTASTAVFTTAHLYMSVYRYGQYLGEISDVAQSGLVAYLDRDVPASLVATSGPSAWEIVGHNDRIWPSAYDFGQGNVPTVFPECAQLNYYSLLTQALDQGQQITGLIARIDELRIAFDSSFVRMTGGNEVGFPQPILTQALGTAGCVAPRSLCQSPSGEMAWVGVGGIYVDSGSGAQNMSAQFNCSMLFKGGQWIARADLSTMVMAYSREFQGFVFGNFTIGGVAGWWGLLTVTPQPGIWLFENQKMTANLVEYVNGSGQSVLLAGDHGSLNGRIKKLLDPTVLTDIGQSSDTAAAYSCKWREGYIGKPNGERWSPVGIRMPSIVPPGYLGSASFTITLEWIRTYFPQRELALLPTDATYSVSAVNLALLGDKPVPLTPNRTRFHSIGLSYDSTTGDYVAGDEARPIEISSWVVYEAEDAV